MDWDEHFGEVVEGEWYCSDLSCWCHTDVEYHDTIQHPEYSDEDLEQVYVFYEVLGSGQYSKL
jgi:hypothetical protein